MKITKPSAPPSIWRGVCRACQAEAEAVRPEMTHITEDQREGGRFSWETCPECGAGEKGSGYGGMLFCEVKP